MMKVPLSFIFIFVFVQARPKLTEDEIKAMNKTCLKETGLDDRIVKNIVSFDTFPKPSDKYYKYLECMYINQGYLDSDGLISYQTIEDFILDFYDLDTVKLAIEPCVIIQDGRNGGERAYNAAKCLLRNLEALEKRQEKEDKIASRKST
ncbi:hypothetical protein Trydic_g2040 [Trypoxylus dichotomus]